MICIHGIPSQQQLLLIFSYLFIFFNIPLRNPEQRTKIFLAFSKLLKLNPVRGCVPVSDWSRGIYAPTPNVISIAWQNTQNQILLFSFIYVFRPFRATARATTMS